MTTTIFARAAGLAAVLVLVAACGGKDEKGAGSAAASGTAAPAGTASFADQVKSSQPLAPTPAPQDAAGRRYVAEICKVQGGEPFLGKGTSDVFKAVEIQGSRLIVADNQGILRGYTIAAGAGCSLTLDPTFGTAGLLRLPDKIENLTRDGSDGVIASNGIFAAHAVHNGKYVYKCDTKGHVELHSSGQWGIAPWVNATVKMAHVSGNACRSEDWVLKNLSDDAKRVGPAASVTSSAVIGDTIYLGASRAEKNAKGSRPVIVLAYSKDGKEKLRFGNIEPLGADGFGWVHAIAPCKAGVCVLDSNFRRVSMWSTTGAHAGNLDLSKLFGLPYPWISDMTVARDGTAYFVASNDRGKSGVAEGVIYRVSGL